MLFEPRTEVVAFEHGPHRLVGDLVLPAGRGPHPLVVTVFGSGPGGRYAYDWPDRFAAAGFAFYSYDRPGCGESTGDWRGMDFADRAGETLAAVAALAGHADIDASGIALVGGSQGGWIAPLAAATGAAEAGGHDRGAVAAVVTFSGPGVSPATQEQYRIANVLTSAGLAADDVAAGLAAFRRTQDQLRAGGLAAAVLSEATRHEGSVWLPYLMSENPSEADLEFIRGILDYDPLPALRALHCPYLAVFGESDTLVPVDESVRVIDSALADVGHPDYQLVVFPNADHRICPIGAQFPGSPLPQRAAGFFEMIIAWLTRRLPPSAT